MMKVNSEKCIGCGECVTDCLANDIELKDGTAKIHNVNCFKCGHCIAICPENAVSSDEYDMSEVKEYNEDKFSVEADNLLNFIKFRRTIRQFKDQEVEDNKISKIIEAGRFTPTGSNMQDVSFTVVQKEIPKFRKLILESLKNKGEHILDNLSDDTMKLKKYAQMWIKMYKDFQENPKSNDKLFFNAPAVIVVTAKSEVNASLASANMELMANALDLGVLFSGFTVRGAQDNQQVREFIEVPEDKKVVTTLVIGYPDVQYFRTVPREESEVTWK